MQPICGQTRSASLQVDYTVGSPAALGLQYDLAAPFQAYVSSFSPFPSRHMGLNNLGERDLFFPAHGPGTAVHGGRKGWQLWLHLSGAWWQEPGAQLVTV